MMGSIYCQLTLVVEFSGLARFDADACIWVSWAVMGFIGGVFGIMVLGAGTFVLVFTPLLVPAL